MACDDGTVALTSRPDPFSAQPSFWETKAARETFRDQIHTLVLDMLTFHDNRFLKSTKCGMQ